MTHAHAKTEAARAVRIAESLVESLGEAIHQYPTIDLREAHESALQTLGAVREAARKLNEEQT